MSENKATHHSDGVVCNIYFEEFTTIFTNLLLSDPCTACGILGARHERREKQLHKKSTSSGEKHLLSATTQAYIKLEKLLPEYTKATDVRQFIKRLELILHTN